MTLYHKERLKQDSIVITILLIILIGLNIFKVPWFCPFHDFLGVPCPGCGFTTALKALLSGDLIRAYKHHPMVFIMPLFVLYYFYAHFLREQPPKYYRYIVWTILSLFVLVYLSRWFNLMPGVYPLKLNPDAVLPSLFK